MNEKEFELLNMVYENDDPGQAVLVAIKVFAEFLERCEEGRVLPAAGLQVSS